MKVKLIFPFYAGHRDPQIVPSLAIATLYSFLKQQGCDVEQLDLNAKVYENNKTSKTQINMSLFRVQNQQQVELYLSNKRIPYINLTLERIIELVNIENLNLIGFSILSVEYLLPALCLSKKIKEKNPDIKVIFGGPFLDQKKTSKEILKDFDFIDYLVRGEGELALLKLVHYLEGKEELAQVPNLIYRSKNQVKANKSACLNAEEIPPPDYSGLNLALYEKVPFISYYIAKGCINRCTFCTGWLNHKFERKSINKVIKELKLLKEKYSDYINFNDNLLNSDYDYLTELCDKMISNHLNLKWDCLLMPKNLDKPLLQKMKEAGCQRLQYGVESGSPAVLRDMGKTFKPEEATKIIRWTDEVGICGTVNLIAGFPTETEQNLRETMKFLKNSLSNTTHITINLFMFGLSNESIIEKVPERFNILIKHPKKQGLLGNYTTPPIYIKPGIGDPYPQKQDHYRKIVEFIKNNNLKFQNAGDVRRMLEMINVDNKRAKLK